MHEVGIIAQTLDMAVEAARREGAERISLLRMKVGVYSGVVPDALRFAFDVVTQGTMAEGASLVIEEIDATCRCPSGCPDFVPDGPVFLCPQCGALASDMLTGRELLLTEIEVT